MSNIKESIVNKYIDEYLENSKKINYTDLSDEDKVSVVLYKDLPKTNMNGYPIASDYLGPDGTSYSMEEFVNLSNTLKSKCKLRYYYLPNYHELYVGTTGSGKTTGCVEPQLRAISYQKNKPNLFITDPKGELFNHNAEHLINQGYKVYMLNFKDIMRSDKWNPLQEVYDLKIRIKNIGKNVDIVNKADIDKYKKMAPDKAFDSDVCLVYDGKVFPNDKEFKKYLVFEKDFLEASISDLVNQLANMFIKVESLKDPSWEYGAQDLLKGIIQCMLEDAVNDPSFTKDMMSIKTIHEYYLALRNFFLSTSSRPQMVEHPLLKNKSQKTLALMSTSFDNAPNTMRSYCGVFDGSTKDWFQGHIFALTTGNTIDIDSIGNKPFAIFIITRDYEKSDFQVAGLFIDWVYRKMIEKAENSNNTNTRPMHFLLDEFGNIPEIKDFENKISTSRSRNIWFHLVVQSYKQIDMVYGDLQSGIIRDNCNAQIFLGSQNRRTKEIFSEECGKRAVVSLGSYLNSKQNSVDVIPLLPVSTLELIKPGKMYLKRLYMPVITTQFIRSYICAENGDYKSWIECNGLDKCTPFIIEGFNSNKYTYKLLTRRYSYNDNDY